MPKYTLIYKKPASKEIQKLPLQVKKRLKLKLEWFIVKEDPISFAKALTKPSDAQYRFRVGSYRILFDVEEDKIVILHIQHRREVYK
jgi:mRNA interferase RelE/StbE